MKSREMIIKSENGIGAKQAAKLVDSCQDFSSEIYLEQGNRKVNAKSIMGVISLALKLGDSVTILASGDDEAKALASVFEVLSSL